MEHRETAENRDRFSQTLYVAPRPGFALSARRIAGELRDEHLLGDEEEVCVLRRYDVVCSRRLSPEAIATVFADPAEQMVVEDGRAVWGEGDQRCWYETVGVRYHAGQFDQRADAAEQALRVMGIESRVRVGEVFSFALRGVVDEARRTALIRRLVNPVDSEVISDNDIVFPLSGGGESFQTPRGVIEETNLNGADRAFVERYFSREERREPTATELAVIDTYWSDHCRHTTFRAALTDVQLPSPTEGERESRAIAKRIEAAWEYYLQQREARGERERPITLMDIGTAMMRWRGGDGTTPEVVFSEEINACTVRITPEFTATLPGAGGSALIDTPWEVLFKNETHNHPTEIEPYGGAATCLGGAIRDPLSGRSYVYQAMRLTGCADPRRERELPNGQRIGVPAVPGKLSQARITRGAAHGYSSYGNQIGVATGLVDEVYHRGYRAKRLEMGAVVGAIPAENVRRERPVAGDVVLLVGGRTGRDGVGGATGSSKSHDRDSLSSAGAEVQKGNPPVERALQRLYRSASFSSLVKRSNDFGAGGVAVAVGELAEGLEIDLDAVPLKYAGLNATEIAISESQERMAVVVAAEDADRVVELAGRENLEATVVARVSDRPRLVMRFRGRTVVDLSREFVDSAGVRGSQTVRLPALYHLRETSRSLPNETPLLARLASRLGRLRYASRLGLSEWFDSSIGGGTLLAHGGGTLQRSPQNAMAARLPHACVPPGQKGELATVMAYGFDPDLSARAPWLGAYSAVIESAARLAACGVARNAMWLSLQEFFPRPGTDPQRWGLPTAALLGALAAQKEVGITAIGGKDSMSGSFEQLDVPPTLISVACGVAAPRAITAPVVDVAGARVAVIPPPTGRDRIIDGARYGAVHDAVVEAIAEGVFCATAAVRGAGWLASAAQMCFGSGKGITFDGDQLARVSLDPLQPGYGAFVVVISPRWRGEPPAGAIVVGRSTDEGYLTVGHQRLSVEEAYHAWRAPLEEIFPTSAPTGDDSGRDDEGEAYGDGGGKGSNPTSRTTPSAEEDHPNAPVIRATPSIAHPQVVIPVFPGTNCEDDLSRAFHHAGARCRTVVLRTHTIDDLTESITELAHALSAAQILMVPGGFSAGDEPGGSGKYIAAVLRSVAIREVIERDYISGDRLILGICNGFQALVRTGLVPFGRYTARDEHSPTLAPNAIGRHVACRVWTRYQSRLGPWLAGVEEDPAVEAIPISHGEGRFWWSEERIAHLASRAQIATCYCRPNGEIAGRRPWNPNGSVASVEGIVSPDGRFLGKMGHNERPYPLTPDGRRSPLYSPLFARGVEWFR